MLRDGNRLARSVERCGFEPYLLPSGGGVGADAGDKKLPPLYPAVDASDGHFHPLGAAGQYLSVERAGGRGRFFPTILEGKKEREKGAEAKKCHNVQGLEQNVVHEI